MDDQRADRESRVNGRLAVGILLGLAFGVGVLVGFYGNSLATKDYWASQIKLLQIQHDEEIRDLKAQQNSLNPTR